MKKYKTTCGKIKQLQGYSNLGFYLGDISAEDPYPPDDTNWKLVTAVVQDNTIFWFWETEV